MPKIKLDKRLCIGCGSCQALCPKMFELKEDGKSHIIGSGVSLKDGEIEEVEAEKLDCAESAAEACPAQCIHVEK